MVINIFILILNFSLGVTAQTNNADNFQTGIRLIQEQKYSDASAIFKSEFEAGKNFAALFYNWGLAEYYQKHLGFAAGLWRRALFVDADLISAHRALEFLQNELPHQSLNDDGSLWTLTESFVAERLTLNKILMTSWMLFVFSGFLILRYLGLRKRALVNETPLPPPPHLGIIFSIFFILTAVTAGIKTVTLYQERATVTAKSAPLRTSPHEDSNTIFDVLEGLDVKILNVQQPWALITLPSGVSGWVATDALFQHSGKSRLW